MLKQFGNILVVQYINVFVFICIAKQHSGNCFYFHSQLQGIPSGIDANSERNQQEAVSNYFTDESQRVWIDEQVSFQKAT